MVNPVHRELTLFMEFTNNGCTAIKNYTFPNWVAQVGEFMETLPKRRMFLEDPVHDS